MGAAAGGPPDDLHHDGVLGSTKGLHGLLMAGLGQLLPVHLRRTGKDLTYYILSFAILLFIVPFLLTVAIETFYGSRAVVEIDLSLLVQLNLSVQSQRTRFFYLSDIRLKSQEGSQDTVNITFILALMLFILSKRVWA